MTHGLAIEDLEFLTFGPFSLTIAPSETVAIHGPSGAGKSLLLRAVADLDPHTGKVSLDGIPCATVAAQEWRQRVGLLPAESQWWYDRVGPHFDDVDDSMLGALGFDRDVLDWSVTRLSVGERQRLGVTRLLTRSPQALLLDEPTANLDPENTERVEGLLKEYQERLRAPLLWVSHHEEQRRRVANRQYLLKEGRLKAHRPSSDPTASNSTG